ncbi:MAG: NAD-dependent DNA ligase LigA [Candidatus Wildermuthbacteria bacterium]|nr:NAD-dependent DNA ligase LigA [Candidatus Wildermuthbacteria bacterium]
MTKAEAKKRVEKLKSLINHHRYLYHVLDKQEISDSAFDTLKHELFLLEQQFPELITPDSPTQRVGGKPLPSFKKVQHRVSMLSIEDIFNEQELKDWEAYVTRLSRQAYEEARPQPKPQLGPEAGPRLEYFAELKIDGFAVSLLYRKGVFVQGATRGNGQVGEDVTQNLKTIESIPLKLELHNIPSSPNIPNRPNILRALKEGEIEVRGEVYMGKREFERLNANRKKQGLASFANPRNVGAGSIRQLDPKLAASRPLKFMAYDLVTNLGQTLHSEEHEILKALGFKTDPTAKVCGSTAAILAYRNEIAKKRESLPFLIDGVVASINQNSAYEKLGVAGKGPRGIRAFKFSGKQATTKILDIKLQVGRTGAVTPVAVLEPVQVAGVTISRATLHNQDEIERLGVKIGDTVIIERAGDVIPAVVKALPELRSGKEKAFTMPKVCPICGGKLVRPEGETVWRCGNKKNCPAQQREFLYHFVSRKAFDIRGLGPKILDRLTQENLVTSPADIFELKEGDLAVLERFGEKSASNIIRAIDERRTVLLHRFIYALGIRHAGEKTAVDLAEYFQSIEKLKQASLEELDSIPNVGGVMVKSIYEWFHAKENIKMIEDLSKEVSIEYPKKKGARQKFQGRTFALTGTLESMSREQAKERIRELGGETIESVSKNTNYVVVGKEPGSKFARAKDLGVKTLTEKEFLSLLT